MSATDTRARDVAALAHTHALRGVMSDADIEALRERNAARLRAEQERLGDRWVMAGTRLHAIRRVTIDAESQDPGVDHTYTVTMVDSAGREFP